ncbi:MAG TPA: thiopeptide-type bacteriocin biosynthesis protein [Longimicrobium sp.]|nr:thiopeptide-type bacteriocin biosynthesis protein [Longimicrobium sp.]
MPPSSEEPRRLPAEEPRWLSVHLFFPGGIYTPECDRVVLDTVQPFVRRCHAEGWVDGYFFIRYSELGPHVRLRFHGRGDVVDETVWPALRAHVEALHPGVVFEPPTEPPQPRSHVDTQEGDEARVTHAALIEYEPETDRYGGPEAVRLAERYFEVSSDATFALLARSGRERSSRLGKGLLSMVVLAHVFGGTREKAADFMHQYGIGYLRNIVRSEDGRSAWLGAFDSGFDAQAENLVAYVEEVWSRMDEGEELSEALDAWHDGLKRIRGEFRELFEAGRLLRQGQEPFGQWEQAVGGIVSSYVHMMNNRLGVSIQEEAYLAYLITRALGRPAEAPAAAGDAVETPAGGAEGAGSAEMAEG